jgi:hypothetical protein
VSAVAPVGYRPSWADRFTAAVIRRSPQPFMLYLAASVVVAAGLTLAEWIDGAYEVGQLRSEHLVAGAIGPIWLWLIGILNQAGARAARDLAVVFAFDDERREDVRRRLTSMPAGLLARLLELGSTLG